MADSCPYEGLTHVNFTWSTFIILTSILGPALLIIFRSLGYPYPNNLAFSTKL